MSRPVLIGHRGVGDPWTVKLSIPEESIPAIRYAAKHHAGIVEGDAAITGDGKIVMMHDATINRTTNRTGNVRERDLAYITKAWLELPVDRNDNDDPDNTTHHPPSLDQWLAVAKTLKKTDGTAVMISVELKGIDWTNARLRLYSDLLKKHGVSARTITQSSEARHAYLKTISTTKRSINVATKPSMAKITSVVGAGGYVSLKLTDAEANRAYVEELKVAGFKLMIWTLDNAAHYARALPVGAYGWFCDNVGDAWKWLEAHSD